MTAPHDAPFAKLKATQREAWPLLVPALLLVASCAHTRAVVATGDGQATVHGVALRYHVYGRGPICLVEPGGPGLSWNYLRMPELEKHLTMVYLEPVGSGDSGRLADPSGYTLDRWVDDLEQIRRHLGLDEVYLLGHSHGGFIAQQYAIRHGDHLRGLILMNTSPRTDQDFTKQIGENMKRYAGKPWFQDAAAALEEEAKAKTEADGAAVARREIPFFVDDYDAHKTEVDDRMTQVRFNPAAEHGTNAPFDVREQLHGVHVPTLVVSAEHDFVCDLRFGREIQQAIAGSRLVLIPAAGHMSHWDQPQAVAQAISSFVAQVER